MVVEACEDDRISTSASRPTAARHPTIGLRSESWIQKKGSFSGTDVRFAQDSFSNPLAVLYLTLYSRIYLSIEYTQLPKLCSYREPSRLLVGLRHIESYVVNNVSPLSNVSCSLSLFFFLTRHFKPHRKISKTVLFQHIFKICS